MKQSNNRFAKESKAFVKSLIRQRQRLVDIGRSRKNPATILQYLDYVNNLVVSLRLSTDVQIAGFLLRNKEQLYYLIPTNQQSRIEKLNSYIHTAYKIFHSSKKSKTLTS